MSGMGNNVDWPTIFIISSICVYIAMLDPFRVPQLRLMSIFLLLEAMGSDIKSGHCLVAFPAILVVYAGAKLKNNNKKIVIK